MTKKLTIQCSFGGKMSPVALYIGTPNPEQHPLNFQAKWLSSEKGGQVPANIMDSIAKIHKVAIANGVSFEDLCFYAVNVANDVAKQEIPEFNRLLLKLE
ncbi:MAG: DUF2610 domain-containing protein [Rickettsiales bacterium]|jgi:hypothetical protein|nr:DUF2610 domain-containing protein [Rickettsiales bacterium]